MIFSENRFPLFGIMRNMPYNLHGQGLPFGLAPGLWPKDRTKEKPSMAPVPTERDLRLDLFRGIALWLIFLDHIPSNAVSWITIRNYGFSDATEIFVFISGYTAAFVYGRAMREHGFIVASARVLKRAWQIYIAHVFLFVIYLAEISYVASSFNNPLFSEEMGVLDFLKNPDVTIFEALILKFKPVNMDVLPLYIVLLLWFAPMLWLLLRAPSFALIASATVYALTWWFDWSIPAYPHGTWVFNPFAWQLLFVFGAWCALGGAQRLTRWLNSPVIFGLAVAYLLFAFCIAMTWYFPRLAVFVPKFVSDAIYPIDKPNLDVLRIVHFLSLAVITVWFVPRGWPALRSRFSGRRSCAGSIRWKPSALACSWRSPDTSSSPKCPIACSRMSSSASSASSLW